MIGKKELDNNPIPQAKVKELLEEFRETHADFYEENHNVFYEQNLTLEHVRNFNKISLEDAEELISKLLEEVDILRLKHAIRLVDLMPKDLADLRLIFAKERIAIKPEDMEEILKIIDDYRREEE